MQLRLYSLSPIHIGTGEYLAPMEYVVLGDSFYRIDQAEFYQLVKEILPNGQHQLNEWIQKNMDALRATNKNHEQSRLRDQMNPLSFFQEVGKESELTKRLKTRSAQRVLLDDDNRKRQNIRLGQVREAIRTGLPPQVYIPGTSLKGALRTALLYDYLDREGSNIDLEALIRKSLKESKDPRGKNFAQKLESRVFFCRQQIGKQGKKDHEAQMDLMKFVGFSDATLVENQQVQTAVGKINIYLVERKEGRRRGEMTLIASRQRQSVYAEMIPVRQELHSELTVDGLGLRFLLDQSANGKIKVGDNSYYHQLSDRLKKLFRLSDAQLQLPADELAQAIERNSVLAMKQFCEAQLARQTIWQEDYADQRDPNGYTPRIEAGFAPVYAYNGNKMHLGYASGFNATTVVLHFLQNRKLRDLFEQVMREFKLGKHPNHKKNYQPKISRFPKSRRLVEQENIIAPLGWLALLSPGESPPTVEYPTVNMRLGRVEKTTPPEPKLPVAPEYYKGIVNYKRPPEIDAVVTRTGKPNMVRVYLSTDNSPEIKLDAYRSPLKVGTVIRVQIQLSKKGKVLSAAYRKLK